LVYNDVHFEVLHRRTEVFSNISVQRMEVFDLKDFTFRQICQQASQITPGLNSQTVCALDPNSQACANDSGQCRLSRTRRTNQKNMANGFASLLCRFDG
jgi:hypothetical protein